jgi:hypothetical protein
VPSNQDRLLWATHYVIARCDPAKLGATKLNKVLWFADVIYYRRHGRTEFLRRKAILRANYR